MNPFMKIWRMLSGSSTFQQKAMSWSMRRRGMAERIHMSAKIQSALLKVVMPSCQIQSGPGQPSSKKSVGSGTAHPPRKTTEPKTLNAHMEAYSESWNIDQRMPEYSTKNPPTTSDSATGMSKGARWSSESMAVKKMRKASGWRMT